MNISSFFNDLRAAYQAEMDDLTSDSEGGDVLAKRLGDKRSQIGFLQQMMGSSPEMVAVVFHGAFNFRLPAVMDDVLSRESEDLPDWSTLADAVQLAPWALPLAQPLLKSPLGDWFMTVAAALEYMHGKYDASLAAHASEDENDEDSGESDQDHDSIDRMQEGANEFDNAAQRDARAKEDAGADWMAEQGFDRKG